jgi:hypothetical protein
LGEDREARFDNPEERTPGDRCLLQAHAGPPLRNAADLNLFLIVQTTDSVVIVSEGAQTPRIVRIGGDHDPAAIRRLMGDSVGHWEGRTLVVETINFHPAQYRAGAKPGGETRVVERFTRTGPQELHYAFTVENPTLYTQRWRGEMVFRPAEGRFFEYACHEGNYAMENILRGGRVADAAAKEPKSAAAAAEP